MAKISKGANNEVKLNPLRPIPLEMSGRAFYLMDGDNRYIPFLDSSDSFFNVLLEARLGSPTTDACITTRADYCTGNGLMLATMPKGKKLKEVNPELYAFLRCVNEAGDSLKDLLHEINQALDQSGNCWVEIVRVKVGTSTTIEVYVWNTAECRLAEPEKGKRYPTSAFRSKKFLESGYISDLGSVVKLPLLMGKKPLEEEYWLTEKLTKRTVVHLKTKKSGYPNYGLPVGVSSLLAQVGEFAAMSYNNDNLNNNLSPGGFIGVKGNVSQIEANKIGTVIAKQLKGKGNAGKWIAIASEQGLEGIDIEQFSTTREGSFIELFDQFEKFIFKTYQWNKVLAGMDDGSALGKGANYLKTIYDLAMKKVIIPRQTYLMEAFIEPLLTICDDAFGTKWADEEIVFSNPSVVSFITMIKNIDPAIRINEVREELGLEIDEAEGDSYMGATAAPTDPNADPNADPAKEAKPKTAKKATK